MLTLENVKDEPTAKAKNYFTSGNPKEYTYEDIEATCYELFYTVIDRCKYGFRGNDRDHNKAYGAGRVSSGPANSEPDRVGDCATRIQNVVHCLEKWKNACADIMHDDRYIFLLANHPYTYALIKDNNRRCNKQKKQVAEKGRKALARLAEADANEETANDQRPAKKARIATHEKPPMTDTLDSGSMLPIKLSRRLQQIPGTQRFIQQSGTAGAHSAKRHEREDDMHTRQYHEVLQGDSRSGDTKYRSDPTYQSGVGLSGSGGGPDVSVNRSITPSTTPAPPDYMTGSQAARNARLSPTPTQSRDPVRGKRKRDNLG